MTWNIRPKEVTQHQQNFPSFSVSGSFKYTVASVAEISQTDDDVDFEPHYENNEAYLES